MAEVGVIFLLLAAVAGLATIANKIRIPYPILLVVSGLALAFVPSSVLPRYDLDPEIIFVLFLPPLLFASAFFTSWRDFTRNLRAISLLAIGLVLMTMVAVAAVAHYAAGLGWPAAFVLGAVVSPTDAIAATAIAQRLGVPRRIVTILEGESLVNDATGIVAYRIAEGVAVGAIAFSFLGAGLQFVFGAAGGIAVGLAVGWIVVQGFRRLHDTPVEIVVSLLAPFTAYLAAEELPLLLWHELLGFEAEPFFSGVLAAVAGGLYVGRNSPTIMSPSSRLEGAAVWNVVVFLLNGLAFILIGLQFPETLEGLSDDYGTGQLVWYAVAAGLTVVVVRMLWVFPATYLPRLAFRSLRERDPAPSWRSVTIIAWSGMRGVISLAAALALPEALASRDLILFLTFNVILVTLVLQGLSLPFLIRLLGLEDDGSVEREETYGRIATADAALARINELAEEDWVREDTAERIRGLYGYRRGRFVARKMGTDDDGVEERSRDYQRLLRELLQAQRGALVRLRDDGTISDEALHRIERDLDLEETRLDS